MGIVEPEPQDAPPEPVGCPVCRRADGVRRVPAAVGDGWRLPAAAPAAKYGRPLLLAVVGAIGVCMGVTSWLQGTSSVDVVRFVFVCVLMVSGVRKTVAVSRRRKRIRLGEPAASAVWNEGWLCARCEVIYFQPGYEPRGVGLNRPLRYEEFQLEVYRAGGYEDLADKAED